MRKVVQIIGELLLTAGVILLLFVGWELWWTNGEADAKPLNGRDVVRVNQ